ncbi:hypothetical protein [Chondromyces apiculatus]|uniref:Uncharacterized protein n=1 Tax=Chondromyces apiculatus DSM 436 TaxID=1192034 RepID=A0A017T7W6_9BACT|nr:hypothetical protein [Chondromyces apiculatus]EYF04681.1 Hypothetical protein CAP_4357 [Chondromyces apiculatus DSM 436]
MTRPGPPPLPPWRPAFARLAEKYRQLGALRRARALGEPVPERQVFRALAAEFPGALHELDNLPLDEIDARRAALDAAVAGGPAAPWMEPMAAYHALMRAALYLKIRLSRLATSTPTSDEAEAAALASLAARASAHSGIDVDVAFARAVHAPPEGRLNRVVMAALAERSGLPPDALRQMLFPRRARRSEDPLE